MPPASRWQSPPLFVTSTFRDVHAERDHLRAVVFPALEERLRARAHHLEPIDLRLGGETAAAPDEAARDLLVLEVCLGEIERSRPFLIGLLGDRYGGVPPPERVAAAAQEAGWTHDLTGRSVTALEVEFGVAGRTWRPSGWSAKDAAGARPRAGGAAMTERDVLGGCLAAFGGGTTSRRSRPRSPASRRATWRAWRCSRFR